MEFPIEVDEVLSDDYEEGEILEGDNLYDDVSSLEEFVSGDEGQSQLKTSIPETEKEDPVSEKKLKHRRKDHKCKENSVCRKERKGKHCYARIRKAKSSLKYKTIAESVPQSTVERVFPRKPDLTPIMKHLKCRPPSPYKTKPDLPKIPHRYDFKDYHEKENRHNNKRFWASPPRSKLKPPDKHNHYNRNKGNKDNHCSKSRYQTPTPPPPKISSSETSIGEQTKNDNSYSKTSLLKRLVGSGTSGVKPIKENEPVPTKSDSVPTGNESTTDSVKEPASENEEIVKVTEFNSEEDVTSSNGLVKSNESQKTEEALPEPPKKIEVKWIRSMKEDKDELHLRVEALRSAWIKKFNDRKKKGLIHQKKSDDVDDLLEDFVLDSDLEDENNDDDATLKTTTLLSRNNSAPCFNPTDISGDILKPEDMVIVNDKTSEELIISETAVTTTEGSSSVFVDPLFFSGGHFPPNVNGCQVSNSNGNINLSINVTDTNNISTISNAIISENSWDHAAGSNNGEVKQSSIDRKLNENYSYTNPQNSSRVKSKRTRWRKRRRSKGTMVDQAKNVSNISAELDENALRELALLSVRPKNRNRNTVIRGENENDANIQKESLLKSGTGDKIIASLCESESTGAPCGDICEDDMEEDEDILRARLLSSLTKQVSEESAKLERATVIMQEPPHKDILLNPKVLKPTVSLIKTPTSKKQIMKKLDRRKLRNSINRKVWKQGNISIRKTRLEGNVSVNHFGELIYKKSDNGVQLLQNNLSSNIRPIPQVPQMIITLDDSDSSSDLDTSHLEPVKPLPNPAAIPVDIEANIDLLLREAILNSQLEKGVIDNSSTSKDKEENKLLHDIKPIENLIPETMRTGINIPNIKTPTSTSSSSSCTSVPTPQALKHLPAWQQEEYKRLKKKIAEKEKVLQVTRSRIIEPVKDINANNPVSKELKDSVTAEAKLTTCISVFPVKTFSVFNKGQFAIASSTGIENVSRNFDVFDRPTSKEPAVTSTEIPLNSKVEVCKTPKVEKPCSTEENNASKKGFPNLVSCSIMEEINVMNDVVNDFEKNNSEYMDLKQKTARLKRILKATECKMSVKKKRMFQIRDTITEKERQISSKIATFLMTSSSSNEKNKLPTRDMELVKLKYKEVSLRAQFLFHDFLSEKLQGKEKDKNMADSVQKPESKLKEILPSGNKRTSSLKETTPFKKKLTVKESIVVKSVHHQEKVKEQIEAPLKRNFSGKEREREEWDPNTPVCHYDLNGICRDEECRYQHFKTV